MIDAFITLAFRNRITTMIIFSGLTFLGILAFRSMPIDAIPDLSENQVIVMTEWMGQNPKNIEDQITYPITVSMQGLAGVRDIRATSMFGVSMVTIIFEDDVDIYFARDRVAERLSLNRAELPPGVLPVLGPDATGLGHIFMYTLEGPQRTLTELRTLQDYTVRYALQSVPGVAEVASVGGYVLSYQVTLDPIKLSQYDTSIMDVMETLRSGNNNVSGTVVDAGGREIAVQGTGFFTEPEEVGRLVIGSRPDGIPLTIDDVGSVRSAGLQRRSILADHQGERVGGIVVMRYGENPLRVIEGVKERIRSLEETLPSGITIKPFYDRTDLIRGSVHTVQEALIEEIVITALVLALFLWNFSSALIITIGLITGVLITFILMWIFGLPSNIMSLGGIIIAIGAMVDADIVVCENIFTHLTRTPPKNRQERLQTILRATLEVGKPIIPAMMIIMLSFLPIFVLTNMEGKLFIPLAFTNVFGMIGALLTAHCFVPALCTYTLRGKLSEDEKIPLVRLLQRWYRPFLHRALNHRMGVLTIAIALSLFGIGAATQIGSEFMPPLDEGSILYMPIALPDVSEERVQELLLATNAIIGRIPEVETVVGKAGRAATATDPAPMAMLETFITLKPRSEWRKGMTKEKLIAEINHSIQIDDFWNSFTQPIIGRIDMLTTGVRTQLGLKIFGEDPVVLEQLALRAEGILTGIVGAADTVAIRQMGLRYLSINLDDHQLAQLGVRKDHALATIAAGVGGEVVTKSIDGRKRIPIEVRLEQSFRENVDDIRSLPLMGRGMQPVTLGSVAEIRVEDGPAMIGSENGIPRIIVQTNVRGRDIGSYVEEATAAIREQLPLPTGYSFEWAGQYENQLRAKHRLAIVIPLVLLAMFGLLIFTYKDLALVALVMLTIPLGLVGGVLSLFLTGYNFSVAVWVGFIALFGNAVETGVVIIAYLENAFRERFNLPLFEGSSDTKGDPLPVTKAGIREAILEGATRRLRPILMTAVASILGLVPLLVATGPGADVQRPLALVVFFGLTTSVFLSLIVLPVLFAVLRERQADRSIPA
ncbi:CusA/CzcA family heavy metal efflux RND transporter [Candidatus Peregrinibacteria bacterium CG10_big_fil_rev_8_21_14_0_10_55_24]|nr:MAG: CusA/CzcA family heavy metal efflux RND transporter [Candidatus Peregrinibacteria bacterium CG10_big_fil_rev_8_21_14_0_10_55_24]